MSVSNSNEFFINIKNPPVWDKKKHYFEQDTSTLQFYEEEKNKIKNGITIGGVFIHPWLYFHLNYFITPIPQPNGDEKRLNPPLRDNEWFFAEMYQRAEAEKKGLALFGTRRYSKSTIEASVITWLNTIKANGKTEVVGGDTADLANLSSLLQIALTDIHPAFYIPKNKNDWNDQIILGIKDKAGEAIVHTEIIIKNAEKGTSRASEKGAGLSPIGYVVDEFGKFDFLPFFQGSIPSFETAYGWKCVPILVGTGGNSELSIDASRLLSNPEAYNMLPMDWDYLDNRVEDPKLRTWKRNKFGIFVPAQMSYKTGIVKDDSNLSEYLGKEDKDLKNIKIKVTNWKTSLEVIKKHRKALQNDKIALNKETMYYPIESDDCFLNRQDNPFPAKVASRHLKDLIEKGDTGKAVDLLSKPDGTLTYTLSDKELAPFPFEGGLHDAPVLLFDDPPEFPLAYGLNVAGLDPYKQGQSTTDSIGSFYIVRREGQIVNDPLGGCILASFNSRPPIPDNFDKTCMQLIEGYAAECLMECADVGFIRYLERLNKIHLLADGIDLAQSINPKTQQSTRKGLYPTPKNQSHLFKRVLNYCNEPIVIRYDDTGEPVMGLGVLRIKDPVLLTEIIEYRKDGNFDRIISFGHALVWAEYLDEINVKYVSNEKKEEKRNKKNTSTHRGGMYPTKRFGMY